MPTAKLTETFLRNVERPRSGTVRYWDLNLKGFVAHVQPTVTTFYYDRDNRRHLIGRFPTVPLALARNTARELDLRLRRGLAKQYVQSNPRLSELVDQYVARPSLRSETWPAFVRHAIEKDLGFGQYRVHDITGAMCREAHARLSRRGPTAANRILAALSAVLSFAKKQDPSLPEPVTRGIELNREANALNAPIRDLRAWREAVDAIDNEVHRTAYMLALFTGLRRSELEQLEWSRIDDDAIYLPTTKSGREFWLPLVDVHHQILSPMRGLHPRFVFPANSKTGHIVEWRHRSVPGTIHSLRHTFATVGVEAGVPEEVIGRLLNHASRTITGQRYVRPNLTFLRSAISITSALLQKRINPEDID